MAIRLRDMFFRPDGLRRSPGRLRSVLEAFGIGESRIDEVDPSEPKPKLKHPGSSMPTGVAGKVKPQFSPPTKGKKKPPPKAPPSETQKAWQATQDFVKGLGNKASPADRRMVALGAGKKEPPFSDPNRELSSDEKPKYKGSYVGQAVPIGSVYQPTMMAYPKLTRASIPTRRPVDTNKLPFVNTVGEPVINQKTGERELQRGAYRYAKDKFGNRVMVPELDPETGAPTGEMVPKRDRLMSQHKDYAVWDGHDWIPKAAFDKKFAGAKGDPEKAKADEPKRAAPEEPKKAEPPPAPKAHVTPPPPPPPKRKPFVPPEPFAPKAAAPATKAEPKAVPGDAPWRSLAKVMRSKDKEEGGWDFSDPAKSKK